MRIPLWTRRTNFDRSFKMRTVTNIFNACLSVYMCLSVCWSRLRSDRNAVWGLTQKDTLEMQHVLRWQNVIIGWAKIVPLMRPIFPTDQGDCACDVNYCSRNHVLDRGQDPLRTWFWGCLAHLKNINWESLLHLSSSWRCVHMYDVIINK